MSAALIARFHFLLRPSRPAVTFALRTTATALAALLIAVFLGLDSPHWAAMTVWIVAQPTRGMVLSKGLYRLGGTVLGSVAAALIIVVFGHAPLALSLALAVWVGLCAGGSTLLRGFRAYGAVLAGYSAALVAVVGLSHHDDIAYVALTRVASVALGIVVSGVATSLFLPGSSARDLLVRARILSRDTLRWAAQTLETGHGGDLVAQQHRLLAEIAQINAQGDLAAAGSRDLSMRIRRVRAMIAALLTLMAQIRARAIRPQPDDALLATALRERYSPAAFTQWPDIAESLGTVAASYRALSQQGDAPETAAQPLHHWDWRAAGVAGLRAFAGVAAVGVLWGTTGWTDGPPMLLATAIMCSVFAATDTPSLNVLQAMKGATLAVAVAMLCVLLLVPVNASLPVVLAILAPFMVLGGLAMANRATIIPGTDYSMVFLLLSQPGVPQADPAQLIDNAIGIVCGMAAAALINRIGAPTNPSARLDALSAEIVRDLRVLARAGAERADKWQAKAFHRILRLVLKANDGADPGALLEGALAALNVGMGMQRLRPHQDMAGVREVLAAFAAAHMPPEQIAALAHGEADRLGHGEPERTAASALREMADALAARPGFFRA